MHNMTAMHYRSASSSSSAASSNMHAVCSSLLVLHCYSEIRTLEQLTLPKHYCVPYVSSLSVCLSVCLTLSHSGYAYIKKDRKTASIASVPRSGI